MNLFSEIEKTIERGFRKWTDRMLGPSVHASSNVPAFAVPEAQSPSGKAVVMLCGWPASGQTWS